MTDRRLHLVVRTPHAVVAELDVLSLRVPTESGQVGVRPRGEPAVLAVEPGLALARTAEGLRFIGMAGGLLRTQPDAAVLLTPFAALGSDVTSVLAAEGDLVAGAAAEHDLRRAIERLETGLLGEIHRGEHGAGR